MPNIQHGDTTVASTFPNCLLGTDLCKLDFSVGQIGQHMKLSLS